MTQIVAVTGGIGSGKTQVCHAFAALGVTIVDLDQIAHAMSEPGSVAMQQIRVRFGDSVFDADGGLNRAALRAWVFAEPAALEDLNAIMHPAIREAALQHIAQAHGAPYVILAIPLLVESRADWLMIDHVIVVDCPESIQIERLVTHRQLSREMATMMMQAQSSREERLAIADTVIENQAGLSELVENVHNFHKKYLKTCLTIKTIS